MRNSIQNALALAVAAFLARLGSHPNALSYQLPASAYAGPAAVSPTLDRRTSPLISMRMVPVTTASSSNSPLLTRSLRADPIGSFPASSASWAKVAHPSHRAKRRRATSTPSASRRLSPTRHLSDDDPRHPRRPASWPIPASRRRQVCASLHLKTFGSKSRLRATFSFSVCG